MFLTKGHKDERRRYIRLGTVFPVQFRLVSPEGKRFLSEWMQGFTDNVGKGGICLTIHHLNPEIAQLMRSSSELLFLLEIEMPIFKKPVSATAKKVWMREILSEANGYLVGLSYQQIGRSQNAEIMRYARMKRLFVPGLLVILGVLLATLIYKNYEVDLANWRNRMLSEGLRQVTLEAALAKRQIIKLKEEEKGLREKLARIQSNLKSLEDELKLRQQNDAETKRVLQYISEIVQKKAEFEQKIISLQRSYANLNQEAGRLDTKKSSLKKETVDTLYHWLATHQNPRTGLVASFEGDGDITDWAFIYDQSLACQAFILYGDFNRAAKILDFFAGQAKRIDGRFVNAYYVKDGLPAEYIVHTGPNIWVGIAALQYTSRTKDKKYLGLAEEIAQSLLHLQRQDNEGGLRGGPNTPWYSTEHNLDAYAFFNMLERMTGKEVYTEAKEKVLNWLRMHAYDRPDIPVLRGRGDSTIATDTYAWSIAALGPEKLQQLNMDPDEIIAFAEKSCVVETDFVRPDGSTIKVKGFDFAPQRHVARGGVVSVEWTAQMCVAYQIMMDFCQRKGLFQKAREYEEKADFYLAELSRMMISSLSPTGQGQGCLPYASQEAVDTGHGWRTPKGKATGSVAATAYAFFAYLNYNPLQLKK